MSDLDPFTGKVLSNSFEDQMRQCFINIKTILEEAGSIMSNIVKTTIFMFTSNDFNIINKIHA